MIFLNPGSIIERRCTTPIPRHAQFGARPAPRIRDKYRVRMHARDAYMACMGADGAYMGADDCRGIKLQYELRAMTAKE